jgi:alpha-beta hydrolase superfamily lysophospholipase
MTPLTEDHFFLPSGDEHRIECFAWKPEHAPRAVVQIAHGMAEHSRRYRHVAQALLGAGFAAYANEHRGHGQAARDAGTLGDFGPRGFAALPDDMARLTRHIRQQHPGTPVVLLGHSMGSFASQLYLLDHAPLVNGIALSGSAAIDLLVSRRPSTWKLEDANNGIVDPRTPFDWLSRDPAVPAAYLADPLCGFAIAPASRQSMYQACARTAVPSELESARHSLPLYLFTGDRDPINQHLEWFEPLAARLRAAGFVDVSTHVYGGARHEVLNETNRAEVIANLIAWVQRLLR